MIMIMIMMVISRIFYILHLKGLRHCENIIKLLRALKKTFSSFIIDFKLRKKNQNHINYQKCTDNILVHVKHPRYDQDLDMQL